MIEVFLAGEGRNELLGNEKTDQDLVAIGIQAKHTAAMLALVERCEVTQIPPDAASLRAWLALVERHLAPT